MIKIQNKTTKLTFSAIIMTLYIVIMYVTQAFAFGPYQIRIATCLYALSYLLPMLVLPLGLANFLSNLLGGFGIVDMVGGCLVGIITSGAIALAAKFHLPKATVIPLIIIGPGLLVPIWLSPLTGVPYGVLVISLCIGQVIPGIVGYLLVGVLGKLEIFKP